jgi:hypothetical protein
MVEPTGAAGPTGAAEQLGANGPAGVAGPPGAADLAPYYVSSPGDHHSHKHTLDGWDVPRLCRFVP